MKNRIVSLIVLLCALGIGFFVYHSQTTDGARFPFKLGLDLSGGTQLTYRADVSGVADGQIKEAVASLRDVIERRVNLFGVSEPIVQAEESGAIGGVKEHRIIVELPGVTDVDEAVRQLGKTPLLEFKLLSQEAVAHLNLSSTTTLSTSTLATAYIDTGLTGRFLKKATLQFGNGVQGGVGSPSVLLQFDDAGKDLFAKITGDHVGEILAIFLDGKPITEPVIQTAITDGSAVITGTFTAEEARELVRNLNFGALPVPVELVGTQSVGASLGDVALRAGVVAGLWGLLAVALFLILWYRLPGLVAVIALGVYVVLMLALFKLIPVTLTAAGIAGFILSIGMAVDANVLIFERMKDEFTKGRDVETGIREGFARAWLSIRDGNLSTLITAVVLFWFGTSLIQGFALTLSLGVIISMLTAITVTRVLLFAVAPKLFTPATRALFGVGFTSLPSDH